MNSLILLTFRQDCAGMHKENSFRDRLDAVNRELGDILNHNAVVQDQLLSERARLRSYYADGDVFERLPFSDLVMGKIRPPAVSDKNVTSSLPTSQRDGDGEKSVLLTTTHDVLRREVREAIVAEMQVQNANLEAIIAREWEHKLRDVDGILRGRFGELRGANEALQRVVCDLADELSQMNENIASRFEKMESDFGRKLNSFKREHDETVRQLRCEIRDLSDTLVNAKLDATSVEKRFDEIGKRLQEDFSKSMRALDQKWIAFEDGVGETLRAERKQHAAFADTVEKTLSEHTDRLRSDKVKNDALQQEVTSIAEDAVGLRSQLRLTRGELNQLEMLVRSVGVRQHQTKISDAKVHADPLSLNSAGVDAPHRKDAAAIQVGSLPFAEGIRLQQDVYALKQSVAYLADVVERRLLNATGSDASSGSKKSFKPHHVSHSPTRYRVPESDEESNANLVRSSID